MTKRPRTRSGRSAPLAAALAAALMIGCAPPPDERPDVVLILIDTLRPDHLGFYGFEGGEPAPFLAELAERSTVFDRAFSTSSWTAPSTASVFTSLYPNQHGVTEGFFHQTAQAITEMMDTSPAGAEPVEISVDTIDLTRLPANVASLPQAFQASGYSTFGIGCNINIGPAIGFDQGFDRFRKLRARKGANTLSAKIAYRTLLRWKDALDAEGPDFFYLHFNDVHGPHATLEPWYEPHEDEVENERSAYVSEIAYVDQAIREMYETFGWEDAIVMVVSDHGQEFMEHGGMAHGPTLYYELLRVLTMVCLPPLPPSPSGDGGAAGRRVEQNVSLIDVAPTLAELAGVPPDPSWEGLSLVPLLGDADPGRARALREELDGRVLFAHRTGLVSRKNDRYYELFGAIQGDWKLIRNREEQLELYDFASDPLEAENLVDARPEITERLERHLREFQRYELVGGGESVLVELDEETQQHLEALGYAGD